MARRRLRAAVALGLTLFLGSCFRLIPPSRQVQAPPAANALVAGIAAGPSIAGLAFGPVRAEAALASFRESCPRLLARGDESGLTRPGDWAQACTAADRWPAGSAAQFFTTFFETARVGDGGAFVTGYYEPEISGSRTRQPDYDVPVYAMPSDLVRARPGDAPPNPNGTQPLGRYAPDGSFVPYYTRAEIDAGALAGKGLEIAWAADPLEFFFLQIQGSGRLRAADGSVVRIGYAGQNGQEYTGIGGVMRQRGLIGQGPGQYSGSMQGIMRYVREHPVEGRALMEENKSYIFFRELTGDGPIGSLGVPVRGQVSLAADPAFVPLGAPVWLALDRKEADGLWITQDTGGAIKGANRFDSFWGAGDEARTIAGGMSGRGQALVLLPRGTLQRLGAK